MLRFFHFYAKCKELLNFWRRRLGHNACDGWRGPALALRLRPAAGRSVAGADGRILINSILMLASRTIFSSELFSCNVHAVEPRGMVA